ncbi:MAG: hypothetical protein A2283_03240 [Lentisphaerae bacterium RIFOXYA12_FULL_48_11]|nr:MAG: hypothetical protein A2283_03240 [Lentisphaerae bacterium RIFOXYA12_FULL_48_11]
MLNKLIKNKQPRAALLYVMVITILAGCSIPGKNRPFTKGFFQPTDESLKQYQYPDWFLDAKFGIWAHWGPQAVPMAGDWYARHMYVQGHRQYQHHLENYGHPSEHGYKDIIPLWKAEKWDPDRLMSLYKKAGAKYFVSMGCHHDNFDLWNSKYNKWNAVNMGPKRDVVQEWQKAARKYGLRFGVSEHMGASFTWFQDSHKADKTGPKAGIPYDGANEKYWDLYHKPADTNDRSWYSTNSEWHEEWYKRVTDLIDNYDLDLLYTDGALPFGKVGNDVGRKMVAHLYNKSIEKRGALEAVYNCKQESEGKWVQDLERGVMGGINPYPWQTDTSIGDWYYNKNWKFRPTSWSIHMLVDIVSKNGCLLLNVVQRPDGSLDQEVEQTLEEMAKWNVIFGEVIHGTRPWLVYGEGPIRTRGGGFKEDFAYSSKDIRFTTRGQTLYATALGWPDDEQLVIKSLAKPAGENINLIQNISLIGHKGIIEWSQNTECLIIKVPAQKISEHTCAVKITGRNMKPVKVIEPIEIVKPDAQGTIKLNADQAELHGSHIKVEEQNHKANIGFWDKPDEWVLWKMSITVAGYYKVTAEIASVSGNGDFTLEIADQKLSGKTLQTGSWSEFKTIEIGKIHINNTGVIELNMKPVKEKWHALNLRNVRLTKVQ